MPRPPIPHGNLPVFREVVRSAVTCQGHPTILGQIPAEQPPNFRSVLRPAVIYHGSHALFGVVKSARTRHPTGFRELVRSAAYSPTDAVSRCWRAKTREEPCAIGDGDIWDADF